MITPAQIRAARALLDWDAAELGKRSGVARATIFNIENGVTHGRDESLNKIRKAFGVASVEFIEGDGVRRCQKEIEIFAGPERFQDFTDYIYSELEFHGGDVCIYVTNERTFQKYRKNREIHTERMKNLVCNHGVTGRILTAESEFKETWAKIRKLPDAAHIGSVSFYVFADNYAVVLFDHAPTPFVILHKIKALADAYRQTFDLAWEKAEVL